MKKLFIAWMVALAFVFCVGVLIGRYNYIPKPCYDKGAKAYNLGCVLEIASVIHKYDEKVCIVAVNVERDYIATDYIASDCVPLVNQTGEGVSTR